jgi:zinc transporter 1/2/3
MPGAIALFAIFAIAGVEMTFSPEKRCCGKGMEVGNGVAERPVGEEGRCGSVDGRAGGAAITTTLSSRSDSHSHSDGEFSSDAKITLTKEQEHRKAFLQCVLLEVGILFHSVFIGMNLSVSAGREFVILFIAIVFHRKLLSNADVIPVRNVG